MDLINPNRDNVHSKLNSDFENSPAVSEKISPELQDVFEKINRGDVSCFLFSKYINETRIFAYILSNKLI